ncbi:MAG: PDZ domain-containing protein [Deltaproteobacteria bacterium]|nr:PDZ domain-containing protein [Deltaproteobacteria bacterium]
MPRLTIAVSVFLFCAVCLSLLFNNSIALSQQTDPPKEDKTPPPVLFSVTLNYEFGKGKEAFDAAKDLILKNYYSSTLTEDTLYFAAIRGMLRHISPPENPEHSRLLLPEQAKKIEQSLSGKTVSIGITGQLDPQDGSYTISEVVPGSPADGVLDVFDRILRIDGESLKGKQQKDADDLLAGDEGTKVMLTVVRDIRVFDIQIERKEFKVPNMKVYELPDQIVVVEMQKMTDKISTELETELGKLKKRQIKKLIIDLRNNPGGLFKEGLDLADLFLDERAIELRVIVNAADHQKIVAATPNPFDFNLVILVNKNTASSCEIFTAALQDHKKAKVIGTSTYGKSIIDSLYKLPNEYRIQFISGSMYSPNGKSWYRTGLTPDIEVQQDSATYTDVAKLPPAQRLEKDAPLLSAYNYFKNPLP